MIELKRYGFCVKADKEVCDLVRLENRIEVNQKQINRVLINQMIKQTDEMMMGLTGEKEDA